MHLDYSVRKASTDVVNYCESEIRKRYNKLDLKGKSDKEKLRVIYNYVLTHFAPNTDGFLQNVDQHTVEENDEIGNAYYALKYNKTTCGGYSEITYRLAQMAGIKNISLNRGHFYDENGQVPHQWVSYTTKGKSYVIDPAVLKFWKDETKQYTRDIYTNIFYMEQEYHDKNNYKYYTSLEDMISRT